MQDSTNFSCSDQAATESLGGELATLLTFPAVVYLQGELGAGKTTLCQSIIRGFGYAGAVTSPTYNLIQEYPVEQGIIYHMDLYRLEDPGEIEFLGIEDLYDSQSLLLIEWPDRGNGYLPPSSHEIIIKKPVDQQQDMREITLKFS